MNASAEYWIKELNLLPHPEGGFYREVYRSPEGIARQHLPERYSGERSFMTSIYFLILGTQPALLHRLLSDELWVFLDGSSLTIHTISPSGEYRPVVLGKDIPAGQTLQYTVPAKAWFGETVNHPEAYSLVACVVAPGFDYADFKLAGRANLICQFPHLENIILRLTLKEEGAP